jgi:hypothetical protein
MQYHGTACTFQAFLLLQIGVLLRRLSSRDSLVPCCTVFGAEVG